MTPAEIQTRKAIEAAKVEERRRAEAEKWLAVQTEYSTLRDVSWNKLGIWFNIWNPKAKGYSMGCIGWEEVQATLVDCGSRGAGARVRR